MTLYNRGSTNRKKKRMNTRVVKRYCLISSKKPLLYRKIKANNRHVWWHKKTFTISQMNSVKNNSTCHWSERGTGLKWCNYRGFYSVQNEPGTPRYTFQIDVILCVKVNIQNKLIDPWQTFLSLIHCQF